MVAPPTGVPGKSFRSLILFAGRTQGGAVCGNRMTSASGEERTSKHCDSGLVFIKANLLSGFA